MKKGTGQEQMDGEGNWAGTITGLKRWKLDTGRGRGVQQSYSRISIVVQSIQQGVEWTKSLVVEITLASTPYLKAKSSNFDKKTKSY